MPQYTLLRGARQLLTLRGPDGARCGSALQDLGVIADGSVLIRDGVIAEVGPTRRIENLKEARSALEFDVHNSVVMPGFVDPGLRITLDGLNGDGAGRRPKRIGQFFEETLSLLRLCLQNGTTSVELKGTAATGDYHSDLGVMRRLAKIGNQPVGMVRTWRLSRVPRTPEETREFCETLERLASRNLIHFVEVSAEDAAALSTSVLQGLQRNSIALKVHWMGGRVEELYRPLSVVQPSSFFVPKPLSASEAAFIKELDVPVVFAPSSGPGDGDPKGARHAVDAGLPVALSSGYDSVARPGYSMLMAVSLATVYGGLTLEEAITAATVNAAHVIGRGDSLGSFRVGQRADIIVLNIPDYRDITRLFGINNVGMVLRDGAAVNRRTWKMGMQHEPSKTDRVRAQHIGRA